MKFGEAKVIYRSNREPIIVEMGEYVTCAVTGHEIPLEDLKYWNVERQEPYKDAYASWKRELDIRNASKS